MFRKNWDGQAVRNIAVYSNKLSPDTGQQLDLFSQPTQQIRHNQLNRVIDDIHQWLH
ncbi:ImpB/MucB/SamB family protein [Lactiplantibacillus plantarum]|uniref:ImpB/MucB/SamB family protein n=1 Tax=Lactiplantibacillus plantarum TaxID=1590 RepID=A0AAW3RF09_LACPN|nr:hypothetical protein nc8_3075 [Lactiplantibacillus plantarum subsp. plantarum NC8]ERO40907.1 hypothetical protein LPLWJ_20280 [Lactiplantibacillus plantarum WJL]KRL36401.1 hypothetical protein FC76_GL000364 [Lactiplantibacillus plantarum subsp. plantarum ATCC 14917 = JCM 1149 = CGMCC 1.2437]KRN36618.1 hypothetical protein IV39_GL000264 [Lactiplantibacillus plantarum]KZV02134.1 ImpB/MucB/SamB family protein [Lactiplantibacillus plantarum]